MCNVNFEEDKIIAIKDEYYKFPTVSYHIFVADKMILK